MIRDALYPKSGIVEYGRYQRECHLISSSAPDNLLAGGYNFLDTIQTKVNTIKKLTLSKEVWQNKKQITLNRVPNE